MVTGEDAYHYFKEQEAFDKSCGIVAYNRTHQEKGNGTVLLPVSD